MYGVDEEVPRKIRTGQEVFGRTSLLLKGTPGAYIYDWEGLQMMDTLTLGRRISDEYLVYGGGLQMDSIRRRTSDT